MKGCLTLLVMWIVFFVIGFYFGTVASKDTKTDNTATTVSCNYEVSEREQNALFSFLPPSRDQQTL